MNLTLGDIALCLTGNSALGAEADRKVLAVRTDSRAVQQGDVFVCLKGEKHDAHDYAAQVSGLGAAVIIADRPLDKVKCPVIVVPDTLIALGKLGRCWRERATATVIAVTGTAGKTTVKELTAQTLEHILGTADRVAKNHKNFNNQVGLPLSILAATGAEDVWVMEAGISKPNDMAELGAIIAPDIALVLNIGPAHLEGLGSLEGVARAKASLLAHVKPGGTGLCCMDYPLLWAAAKAELPGVVGFSALDSTAKYFARFLRALEGGRGLFELVIDGTCVEAELPACGTHFAENAAAVAALCHTLGHSAQDIAKGLSAAGLPDQRFFCCMRGDWCVVDDSYNANPLSMARSIEAAKLMAGDKPLVLVLGDMRELGAGASQAHENLGALLAKIQPSAVFFQGDHAADVARGAGSSIAVTPVSAPAQVLAGISASSLKGGVVLVKGSHSCHMELYAQALLCGLSDLKPEGGEKA